MTDGQTNEHTHEPLHGELEHVPEQQQKRETLRPEIVDGVPYDGYAHYRAVNGLDTGVDPTAVIALVLSICSFFLLPLIPAIVAVAIAPGAKRRIRHSDGKLQGYGLAKAAQIVGWVNIVVCVTLAYFIVQLVQWAFDTIS